MYMRITTGRVRSGGWRNFEAAYRQHIERKSAHGVRARWLVRSKEDSDVFFTIGLFETLADMESYERSDAVRREVLRHIAPFLVGMSTAHHCEVRRDLPLTAEDLAEIFDTHQGH
jgi:heme-degrading monooxygenase HmoA